MLGTATERVDVLGTLWVAGIQVVPGGGGGGGDYLPLTGGAVTATDPTDASLKGRLEVYSQDGFATTYMTAETGLDEALNTANIKVEAMPGADTIAGLYADVAEVNARLGLMLRGNDYVDLSSYMGSVTIYASQNASLAAETNIFLSSGGAIILDNRAEGPQRLTGVATPEQAADATNKQYVDGRIMWGTQAQYDSLPVKDPNVLYVVLG